MDIRYRTLIPALAVAATLCWQAPAFADPPSSARPNPSHGHDQDRRDNRGGRDGDRHNPQDQRYQHPGDREHDGHPPYHADNGNRGDARYPRYPVYPGHPLYPGRPVYPVHPIYPVYPVYPVYPRFPAYYVYRGYPRYYGYYGDRVYHGYYGDPWPYDYGVVSAGRCNTDAVLGVAGAVTGAIIGNSSSAPQNRGIATVLGAIAGGIIGTAVGGAIDEGDRACFGHALELAPIGRPVVWTNPSSHVDWQLLPVRDVSAQCREFDVRRTYYGRYGTERVTACRRGPGEWAFQS